MRFSGTLQEIRCRRRAASAKGTGEILMNWFGKRAEPSVVILEETDADRLKIFADEYAAAKRDLDQAGEAVHVYERVHNVPPSVFVRNGKMFRAMNQRGDPVHQALKNAEQRARYQFGLKLRAYTDMKIRMGLVR